MVMVILLLLCLLVPVSVCESDDPALGYTSGIWVDADDSPTPFGTNEIRWGGDTGYGKSGYRFDGAPPQIFDFDEPFLVGTLWHFNWPIYSPAITWADLNVTLNFTDPLISPDPTFTIRFNHDETTNFYDCSRCEYRPCEEPGCPDRVTFPSAYPEEYFRIGDKLYTLKILGFVDSWPGGTPVEDFITQEYKNNHAYLIGTLSSVLIPEPQINIIKETSDDNATWYDANNPPGPYILVGDTVYWRYIVQNTGNVPMTDITVTDDNGTPGNPSDDFVVCSGFALDPGDHTYCYATGTAVAGQYGNIGTVTGYYSSSPYNSSRCSM
jgi:hypothetical protein